MTLAANIEVAYNDITKCVVKLSGRIDEGDYEKLIDKLAPRDRSEDYVDFYNGLAFTQLQNKGFGSSYRICLDSKGGSFSEAIKISNLIYQSLGTVVPENSKCLSACALIFMTGSFEGEEGGTITDRHMHTSSSVGFHAPSLNFGLKGTPEIIKTAYAAAIADMASIIENLTILNMRRTLVAWMLRTPPDDMFLIDSVGKATRFQISVYGAKAPNKFESDFIANACSAAVMDITDEFSQYGLAAFDLYGIENDQTPYTGTDNSLKQNGNLLVGSRYGYLAEGASTCQLEVDVGLIPTGDALGATIGGVRFDDETLPRLALTASHLHPPMTDLKNITMTELARAEILQAGKVSVTRGSGRCKVISGDKITDSEPCTFVRSFNEIGSVVTTYAWPSGSKTVLKRDASSIQINGKIASNITYHESYNFGNLGDCTLNTENYNTFCFLKF